MVRVATPGRQEVSVCHLLTCTGKGKPLWKTKRYEDSFGLSLFNIILSEETGQDKLSSDSLFSYFKPSFWDYLINKWFLLKLGECWATVSSSADRPIPRIRNIPEKWNWFTNEQEAFKTSVNHSGKERLLRAHLKYISKAGPETGHSVKGIAISRVRQRRVHLPSLQ